MIKPAELVGLLITAVLMFAVIRWVTRAVTGYPGIGTGAALSIEGSEQLSHFADRLGRYGRARLAEEEA